MSAGRGLAVPNLDCFRTAALAASFQAAHAAQKSPDHGDSRRSLASTWDRDQGPPALQDELGFVPTALDLAAHATSRSVPDTLLT